MKDSRSSLMLAPEMFRQNKLILARVLFAALMVIAAFLFRYILLGGISSSTPYVTFFPAVLLAVLFGGIVSGLTATALSLLTIVYFFIDPVLSFVIGHSEDILGMLTFVVGCVMVTAVGEHMLRYRERLEKQSADLVELNSSLMQEITERKQAEESQKEIQIRMRQITDAAHDAILMMSPEGRVTFWNLAATRILGYKQEEALGKNLHEIIAPKRFHQAYNDALPHFRLTGQGDVIGKTLDLFACRKDGQEIPISLSLSSLNIHGGWHAVGVIRDISDRKKAEAALIENEERFRLLVELAPEAILVSCPIDHQVIMANRNAEVLFATSHKDLIENGFVRFFTPLQPDGMDAIDSISKNRDRVIEGEVIVVERAIRNAKGHELLCEVHVAKFQLGGKEAIRSSWIDITKRRQTENAVAASLREKEVLLKEIHHRVKNNLQIISSLLSLQAEGTSDSNTQDVLTESRGRVMSMALIHEQLYCSHDLSEIRADEYLRQLLPRLVSTYKGKKDVSLDLGLSPITLTLDQSIPFGLIVNELITNTLKLGFKNREDGTIHVSTSQSGEIVTVTVGDDGLGMPEGFKLETVESLGLQIVKMLTNQLHGNLELKSQDGTTFRLQFPLIKADA